MVSYFKRTRERIARVKPSEEEFLVIAVLMFFTYGEKSVFFLPDRLYFVKIHALYSG